MSNMEPLRREDLPELEGLFRHYDETLSFVPNSLYSLPRVGGVGGVAGHGDAADLLRDGPDRSLAATRDDHARSLSGEPPRGGGTDPGAATAHDRHLPLQPHAVLSPWPSVGAA